MWRWISLVEHRGALGRSVATTRCARTYGPVGLPRSIGGQWLSVFFVLSGYLISRPFVRRLRAATSPQPDIARYARNRLLRIVPAFWAAVLRHPARLRPDRLEPLGPSSGHPSLRPGVRSPSELVPVLHIGQGWTLGTEMTFYALVPVVARLVGPQAVRAPPRAAGTSASCSIAARHARPSRSPGTILIPTGDNPTWQLRLPLGRRAPSRPAWRWPWSRPTWPDRLATPLCGRLAATHLPRSGSGCSSFSR